MERFETEWGGKKLVIETGKLAQQASGSCVVSYGDTVVLGTAVAADTKRDVDFFPLMVEFEERLYAAGRIKSSRFMKREGRPSDEAILTGRLIDRSIRPLFPSYFSNDTQVVTTVLSVDQENESDIVAMLAASCALAISDIPWEGPLAGIRIGRVGGELIINPTFEAQSKSDLDLIVAGTRDKVVMVEAGAKEVSEVDAIEAIAFAQKHLAKPIALISEVQAKIGKTKRFAAKPAEAVSEEFEKALAAAQEFLATQKDFLYGNVRASKVERRNMKGELATMLDTHLETLEHGKDARKAASLLVGDFIEQLVSEMIIKEGKRVDGRGIDDIRMLTAEVGLIPRTHGSALFSRGETQVLSTVTLGAPSVVQTIEGMEFVGQKRYFHHYNFAPYSVGEIKPMRGPGRREIGHGALAERALEPMLPDKETFPYTIRVVSEVLSSNGSSSMGSTCGSTLSLMDAGVPIKRPVAGIAMGLASNEAGEWRVITDLQDLEDGEGGMDFKIAGSELGITAIQMDTKTKGITADIIKETFERAKTARMRILDVMKQAIAEVRPELSQYAPRIVTMRINPEKIRDVIGSGGKVINEIIAQTGVAIDIEDDGLVFITSTSATGMAKAQEWIRNLTREVEVGEEFEGKVVRIMDFGAFVEILPGQDGMIHISELAHWRVGKVEDVVKIGDMVPVKVIKIDEMGRINLSRKARIDKDAEQPPAGYNPEASRSGRGGDRPQGGKSFRR